MVKRKYEEELKTLYCGELKNSQIKILASAIEIFAQRGFSGSTTSEIAKSAGLSEGIIFKYYRTKKDLLLAIIDCLIKMIYSNRFVESLDKIMDTHFDEFKDFIKAVFKDRRAFALENATIIKILIQEVPFHPEIKEQLKKDIVLPIASRFSQQIEKFKQKGQLVEIPTPNIIKSIVSSLFGRFFLEAMLSPMFNFNEKEDNEYIDFVVNGLTIHNQD